jgi:hypothetical protein
VTNDRVLVAKSEEKRSLGIPSRRWKDNVQKNLKEMGWEDVEWTYLAYDKNKWRSLVNKVTNIWET